MKAENNQTLTGTWKDGKPQSNYLHAITVSVDVSVCTI